METHIAGFSDDATLLGLEKATLLDVRGVEGPGEVADNPSPKGAVDVEELLDVIFSDFCIGLALPKVSATLTLNTTPVRVLRVLREDLRAHVPQRPGRQNVGDERGGGGGGGVRGLVRGRFVFASPCALSTS